MADVRCFEDLVAWRKASRLAVVLIRLTEQTVARRDRDLSRQMRRSAVSISSNIAEGFERGARREFIYFLGVARGSAGELRSQLRILQALRWVETDKTAALLDDVSEVSRIITGLIRSLQRSTLPGVRMSLPPEACR